jgi:transposase
MEVRRVEVITGASGWRRWSSEAKARIVQEAMAPGAVVSVIARRHGLTPQQVFTWRREVRRRAAGSQTVSFAPVLVGSSTCEDKNAAAAAPPMSMIEVALAGAVVRVPSGVDAAALVTVLRALRSAAA